MKIWLEDIFPPEEEDFELYDGEVSVISFFAFVFSSLKW